MNMDRFTQKSLAAIQGARDISQEYGNQQIEQPHLLLALVSDNEGFIPQLLAAMGMTVPSFEAAVKGEVQKLPKVSGSGREADQGLCVPGCGQGPPRRGARGPGHEGRVHLSGTHLPRSAGTA